MWNCNASKALLDHITALLRARFPSAFFGKHFWLFGILTLALRQYRAFWYSYFCIFWEAFLAVLVFLLLRSDGIELFFIGFVTRPCGRFGTPGIVLFLVSCLFKPFDISRNLYIGPFTIVSLYKRLTHHCIAFSQTYFDHALVHYELWHFCYMMLCVGFPHSEVSH